MNSVKTHLLSGAGNTFHIINKGDFYSEDLSVLSQVAKKICDQVSADGCIYLKTDKDNLSWWFFNKDGSEAEMCGNATRCVGFYVKNILKSESQEWLLKTSAGDIKIELAPEEKFKITMTAIKKLSSTKGFYCNTGVPHLVLEVDSIETNAQIKKQAKELRNDSEFQPSGTNVTYAVLDKAENKVKAVSYERGVEDFTAACGTGAMAAAFYNLTKRAVYETSVEMPGGTLIMNLRDLLKPTMTGPAVLLGSYTHEY